MNKDQTDYINELSNKRKNEELDAYLSSICDACGEYVYEDYCYNCGKQL